MVNSEIYGIDIKINNNDISFNQNNDFSLIKYEDNLKQAIYNRLVTPKGYFDFAPNYGSFLHTLIGSKMNKSLEIMAKNIVFEALLQEPRIDKIEKINVSIDKMKQALNISVTVKPIDATNSLNLVLYYFLGE